MTTNSVVALQLSLAKVFENPVLFSFHFKNYALLVIDLIENTLSCVGVTWQNGKGSWAHDYFYKALFVLNYNDYHGEDVTCVPEE